MKTATMEKVLKILRREIMVRSEHLALPVRASHEGGAGGKSAQRPPARWKIPAVGQIADRSGDRPFGTLISCLLSLRTKDAVTEPASRRLLTKAAAPEAILELTPHQIERLIYPVGFYRTKAKNIHKICKILLDQYDGRVPGTLEELLALPGVGRKTANLVLTVGHDKYGICVDTHVHRISNLWGYVKTRTPEETEFALRKKLPREYWKTYNDLLVTFGQNLCVPVSPWCSRCPVKQFCEKRGLKRYR